MLAREEQLYKNYTCVRFIIVSVYDVVKSYTSWEMNGCIGRERLSQENESSLID